MTIEINYTDNSPKEDNNGQTEFVNKEFMKAFALKKHNTTAPSASFKPSNFFDQIYLYDDATNRRVYFYINGVWRYTAIT